LPNFAPRFVSHAAAQAALRLQCFGIHLQESLMADDLKQTGKPDDARINVDQDHELNYWSEKLGVSRDELRKAVQDAGPMVKDVQRHLGR
jgi:hypothetical protein